MTENLIKIFPVILEDEPEYVDSMFDLVRMAAQKRGICRLLKERIFCVPKDLLDYLSKAASGTEGYPAPHLIIFDHRIENLDLWVFPKTVLDAKKILPSAVRVGLSAYLAADTAQRYINQGLILGYVPKDPTAVDDLCGILEMAKRISAFCVALEGKK